MADELQTSVIYVDANPFMYAVEGAEDKWGSLRNLFRQLERKPGYAVTSELTLAEVLPKAKRPDGRRNYFDLIVWSRVFDLRPVTREILVETADYRRVTAVSLPDGSQSMPRLPDAIHVVTAIRSGCKKFLSDDIRIKLPVGMTLVGTDEDAIAELSRELS